MNYDSGFWLTVAQIWAGMTLLAWLVEKLLIDEEENKPHWSEEDWWVNRHQHRFDDLQDGDYPPLFEEEQ